MSRSVQAQIRFSVSVLMLLSLVACSTFSKKECLNMDWAQRGYTNAMEGSPRSQGQAYYQLKCTDEWQVQVDSAAYKRGYEQGLQDFCTPENAMNFGLRGGRYAGICPKEAEAKFIPQFQTGQLVYLSNRVQELESQISYLENEVSSKDITISNLQSQLSTAQLSCH